MRATMKKMKWGQYKVVSDGETIGTLKRSSAVFDLPRKGRTRQSTWVARTAIGVRSPHFTTRRWALAWLRQKVTMGQQLPARQGDNQA